MVSTRFSSMSGAPTAASRTDPSTETIFGRSAAGRSGLSQQRSTSMIDLVEMALASLQQHEPPGRLAQGSGAPAPSRSSRRRRSPSPTCRLCCAPAARYPAEPASRPSRSSASTGRRSLTVNASGRHVLDGRQGAHANLQSLELAQRRLPVVAPRLGHGQQHLLHVEALDEARQALRAVHLEPGHVLAARVCSGSTKATGL